ncbi:MAG: hypothetical protein CM1200mP28_10230 [Deltaproteobacteria bacterium]|nr:MAG: hypothetical protein CM1200mP28_10230 [Deltaproteobacteria bacterium]
MFPIAVQYRLFDGVEKLMVLKLLDAPNSQELYGEISRITDHLTCVGAAAME